MINQLTGVFKKNGFDLKMASTSKHCFTKCIRVYTFFFKFKVTIFNILIWICLQKTLFQRKIEKDNVVKQFYKLIAPRHFPTHYGLV